MSLTLKDTIRAHALLIQHDFGGLAKLVEDQPSQYLTKERKITLLKGIAVVSMTNGDELTASLNNLLYELDR